MSENNNSVQVEADSPEIAPEVVDNLPDNFEHLPEADVNRIEGIVDEILEVINEEEAARNRKQLRETAAASLNWQLSVQIWEKFNMVWPIAVYNSFRGSERLPPRLEAYCADPRDWFARVNNR